MPRRRKLPRVPDGYKKGKPKTPDWRYEQYIPDWRKHGRKRPPQGAEMRRSFRQKPWNKIQRSEKFWALSRRTLYTSANGVTTVGGVAPTIISYMNGESLSMDPVGAGALGGAAHNCKVHRIQGHIWCWLSPNVITGSTHLFNDTDGTTDGQHAAPNIQMLTYVWIRLKDVADAISGGGIAGSSGNYNPHPLADWAALMTRDDIIKWGTIPVFGAIPRMDATLTYDGANEKVWRGDTPLTGMYLQPYVAKVPYPRVPKLGWTMRKGESLLCIAGRWDGPGAAVNSDINDEFPIDGSRLISTYEQARVLCSRG